MADKMRLEEIFATAPPVANATPSDAAIAFGFVGGAADRPFFNWGWQRYSEILYDVQTQADMSESVMLSAAEEEDTNIIYSEDFNGTIGNDVTAKTPIKGNALRNDSGLSNKYYFSSNTTAVRTDSEEFPLYTDCGQDSTTLKVVLRCIPSLNALSGDGDKIGVVFNCLGKYERTEVALEIFNNDSLQLVVTSYDTFGVGTVNYTQSVATLSVFDKRILTMSVLPADGTGTLRVIVPEIGLDVDTGEPMVDGTGRDDHGFIITPQTFRITDLKIILKF